MFYFFLTPSPHYDHHLSIIKKFTNINVLFFLTPSPYYDHHLSIIKKLININCLSEKFTQFSRIPRPYIIIASKMFKIEFKLEYKRLPIQFRCVWAWR